MDLTNIADGEKDVVKLKDFMNTNKLYWIPILYLMLRLPFNRVDTFDVSKLLRVNEVTIRNNFKRLEEMGLIVEFSKDVKKIKVYHIPANKYHATRKYFMAGLMKHLYDWRSSDEKQVWAWDNWVLFKDILDIDPVVIYEERISRQEALQRGEFDRYYARYVDILKKENPDVSGEK
ncbi:hypothetical protein ACFL96_14015 [Thermoproteota archaeon]